MSAPAAASRIPDAVWLHCILPRIQEDKDKVALLGTCKALSRLAPQVVFTPLFDKVVAIQRPGQYAKTADLYKLYREVTARLFAMPNMEYVRVIQRHTRMRLTIGSQALVVFQKVPRAILERELAHPVQLC